MILILGGPDEAHASFILNKLKQQGEAACYVDTRTFPSKSRITFDPNTPTGGSFQENDKTRATPLSEIRSVYWRYHFGIHPEPASDPHIAYMAFREVESALGSFFRCLDDCLWVNSPQAIDLHKYKGYQLKLMKKAGIRIPETLVTNSDQQVIEFYERLNGNVIYKPVRGGAHTQRLQPKDLKPERLKELAQSPVQFQEMIPGVDIRIYYINGELFPAEIQARSLDFRDDPKASIVPVSLPESVQKDCRTLAQTLGLVFSGIDVRKTPEDEYVFIEGNPSPMFTHFENITGYPISETLVKTLIAGKDGLSCKV